MMRRLIRRGRIVGAMAMALSLASAGCEPWHKMLRHEDATATRADGSKPAAVESDGTKILGVESDAKNPQPFFKNNRRTGGWSTEAREIENSLGVN